MTRPVLLLLLCATMSLFLIGMVWSHQNARNTGTQIVLDMEPVDPRSLLRGHYVTIRTPANALDPALLAGDDLFEKGQRIYVVLQEVEAGRWAAISMYKARPTTGTLYMTGRVWRITHPFFENEEEQPRKIKNYQVQYNIESYFANKVSAKALEAKVQESKMRVVLSVAPNGKTVIRGLEIDGKKLIDKL